MNPLQTDADAKPGRIMTLCHRLLWILTAMALTALTFPLKSTASLSGNPKLTSTVDVREGPGSFFPMVGRLQASASITVHEESDGWYHIESSNYQGWIPGLALETGADNDTEGEFESLRDRFDRAFEDTDPDEETHVSEAQVVAAVKGFITNHIAESETELTDYSDYFEYRYDPEAYLRFRESRVTASEWRRAKRQHRLSYSRIPDPNPDLDMVGWAAGNKIAQSGIYHDPQLRDYLNQIAMLVAESSHRPDLAVNIIILDTDDITGYAVPGGLIFISRGAIQIMRTEAEFAAFVGHEIAHLAFQHGEAELDKRATRIRADDATRRMDRYIEEAGMTDERYREITRELQQTADDLFELLVGDRLHDYEEEADAYGWIYASRAGYRGEALFNVIERISLFHRDPDDERKSAWYGDTIQMRLDALRGELSGSGMHQGNHHTRSWESHTRHLR